MGELASYRFSDFILFSQAAYYRQFELYNHAIWPLHIVAIILALLIIYLLWKKPGLAGRLIPAVLVVSWIWVAWAFLYQRFYQIHVVANWYAFIFILQAGLTSWYGIINKGFTHSVESQIRKNIGFVLVIFSVIVFPFITLMTGRSWLQFEMFALAPDPTVLATLGILLLYKVPKALYIIPLSWILLSAITLSVM